MTNKSKVYGYYGGVRKENIYTPPASVAFVPQTPQAVFTLEDKNNFDIVAQGAQIYAENASNLLQRTSVIQGDQENFTISSPENQEDRIVYYAPRDGSIQLNTLDGGTF